jgi:GT2 family glycosyltransferase
MNHKDVDIIFVCYNNRDDIERCFRSLERNTEYYQRVLVVDNHSEEETIHALSTYGQLLKKGSFFVKRNEKNLGYAKALNQGVRLSWSLFLVFANLDIEFTAGWLLSIMKQIVRKNVAFEEWNTNALILRKKHHPRRRMSSFIGITGF